METNYDTSLKFLRERYLFTCIWVVKYKEKENISIEYIIFGINKAAPDVE